MKRKFAYVFSVGSKVVWSGETAQTILTRASNDVDRAEIELLIERDNVGNFCELSTGEMVFQIA